MPSVRSFGHVHGWRQRSADPFDCKAEPWDQGSVRLPSKQIVVHDATAGATRNTPAQTYKCTAR